MRDDVNAKKIRLKSQQRNFTFWTSGCGKTSLMNLCNLFSKKGYEYKIKPTQEIAFKFASQGY